MTTVRLIDNLAHSTSFRDRDELEASIATMFHQYFHASSIALYRVVHEGAVTRLIRRVLLRLDGQHPERPAPHENSVLLDPKDGAALHQSVAHRDVRTSLGADRILHTAFPTSRQRGDIESVLVVESATALTDRDQLLVHGILRIINNHLALLEYGERDTLTGLLNRKTFEAQFDKLRLRLQQERTAAAATAATGWLGLIDIDRFKSINDSHGHLFGDEVLLIVSQLMCQTLRSSDHVYRFGGEEFVLMLHGVGEQTAQGIFERVRAAIEAHQFPQVGRVTISLGWTELTRLDSPTTCLERADTALYSAKNGGRNRSCRYESLEEAARPDGDIELF
jgi:diguanylate cyclase (GGDEF)-like protein